MGNILMALN
ncbi:Protein of unknown function [Escherichia coli D6-113.11]|nr:Protein of unknown function [Escherichia coli D6-113.11]CDU35833.1 Protein of unknown function [Escherichia coli D6-113.11]